MASHCRPYCIRSHIAENALDNVVSLPLRDYAIWRCASNSDSYMGTVICRLTISVVQYFVHLYISDNVSTKAFNSTENPTCTLICFCGYTSTRHVMPSSFTTPGKVSSLDIDSTSTSSPLYPLSSPSTSFTSSSHLSYQNTSKRRLLIEKSCFSASVLIKSVALP